MGKRCCWYSYPNNVVSMFVYTHDNDLLLRRLCVINAEVYSCARYFKAVRNIIPIKELEQCRKIRRPVASTTNRTFFCFTILSVFPPTKKISYIRCKENIEKLSIISFYTLLVINVSNLLYARRSSFKRFQGHFLHPLVKSAPT